MSAPSDHDTRSLHSPFTREWRPSSSPRGVFLLLHGMESHSGWFGEAASRLVAMGWAVFAFDRSGWGQSPGARGHLTSYRDFVEETAGFASRLREQYPSVHLAGMSWGGMAALYLGLRRGWLFDSLTLLAPGLAATRDIGFADKLRTASDFLRGTPATMVKPCFRPEHFSHNETWRSFVDQDPHRLREVSTGFCLETLKMRRFIHDTAGRRRMPPALCLLAGDDRIIDNARTERACLRAGATVETIDGSAHTLIFDKPDETLSRMARHAADALGARTRSKGTIWILGGGAVGGAAGSLASFGGVDVGILTKQRHLDALRGRGYLLRTGAAKRAARGNPLLAAAPEKLPPNPDIAIVSVKSFDTAETVRGVKDFLPPGTIVVSLQNGLANEEVIRGILPDNLIVAGSICASLEMTAPGEVSWADDRGGIALAAFRGDAERLREVCPQLLAATGMECQWCDGAEAALRLKWSKLMLNTGFNALNSVTGMTSVALLRDGRYGLTAVRALREGFAVMDRLGIKPIDLPGFPVSKLRMVAKLPISLCRRLMAWQSGRAPEAAFSMRQDIVKKRQHTEIEEINGEIVRYGQSCGIATETNKKLVEMVHDFLKSSQRIYNY